MTCSSCDELRAHHLISQVLYRLAYSIDRREFDTYAELFTEDGVLDFSAGPTIIGRAEIRRRVSADLGRYANTHHVITNVQTELGSGSAKARSYVIAVAVLNDQHPEEHWDAGGWYETDLLLTAEGWQIISHRPAFVWTSGAAPAHFGPADEPVQRPVG